MTFKIGDRVRCIDPNGSVGMLELNKIYTILDVNDHKDHIKIHRKQKLGPYFWMINRFELISKLPINYKGVV